MCIRDSTKRIQQALVLDEADIAVHSLKDLPTEADERFTLAAVPVREVVQDCLVSNIAEKIDDLPNGATIGTGSCRRAAQLLRQRPDLNVQPIRGNVQTRLSKLESGEFDAIILAQAGLLRLQMHDVPATPIELKFMLPAPGQGALGIEVRSDDSAALEIASLLNHIDTQAAVVAERTLLANLNGGCLAPIAAYAQVIDGSLSLRSRVLSADGKDQLEESGEVEIGEGDDIVQLAIQLANDVSKTLSDQGARKLIQHTRDQ